VLADPEEQPMLGSLDPGPRLEEVNALREHRLRKRQTDAVELPADCKDLLPQVITHFLTIDLVALDVAVNGDIGPSFAIGIVKQQIDALAGLLQRDFAGALFGLVVHEGRLTAQLAANPINLVVQILTTDVQLFGSGFTALGVLPR